MTEQKPGAGSTLVLIDLYGCREDIITNPTRLHATVRGLILKARLTAREASLDVWETPHEGPSTSYHTLAESHVRASATGDASSFARAEAWTEGQYDRHVNAEFQVCNYNRVNTHLPREMAFRFAQELNARWWQYMVIQRGPHCPMEVIHPSTIESRCKAA